jgi:hypothetical protein
VVLMQDRGLRTYYSTDMSLLQVCWLRRSKLKGQASRGCVVQGGCSHSPLVHATGSSPRQLLS